MIFQKACPACNELNDPDAKFCDHCGRPTGS
ncbi:MAG: zinc-ribbon domain-containing protein [Phycisphaerae bacterium]|nr:zinc-ribbon domain-containing protein [Phycisphaerae bacterium]